MPRRPRQAACGHCRRSLGEPDLFCPRCGEGRAPVRGEFFYSVVKAETPAIAQWIEMSLLVAYCQATTPRAVPA